MPIDQRTVLDRMETKSPVAPIVVTPTADGYTCLLDVMLALALAIVFGAFVLWLSAHLPPGW